jgi:hypothetical protein
MGSRGVGVAFELAPYRRAVAVGHGCEFGVGTVLALQAGDGGTFFVGQVLVGHLCLDPILNEGIKAVHQALIHPIPIRCSSVAVPCCVQGSIKSRVTRRSEAICLNMPFSLPPLTKKMHLPMRISPTRRQTLPFRASQASWRSLSPLVPDILIGKGVPAR